MVVFPACAGMFLHLAAGCKTPTRFPRVRGDVPQVYVLQAQKPGFPRVRGDVPPVAVYRDILSPFSPRARGCSSISATTLPK